MSLYDSIKTIVEKHGNFAEKEAFDAENLMLTLGEIHTELDLIEADLGVNFTIMVTPLPLTPIQLQFIDACIQQPEFNGGTNK